MKKLFFPFLFQFCINTASAEDFSIFNMSNKNDMYVVYQLCSRNITPPVNEACTLNSITVRGKTQQNVKNYVNIKYPHIEGRDQWVNMVSALGKDKHGKIESQGTYGDGVKTITICATTASNAPSHEYHWSFVLDDMYVSPVITCQTRPY